MTERRYSLKQLEEELDVCYTTVLKRIHNGDIKAVTQGGRHFVLESELRRYKEEGNHPDKEYLKILQQPKKKKEDEHEADSN